MKVEQKEGDGNKTRMKEKIKKKEKIRKKKSEKNRTMSGKIRKNGKTMRREKFRMSKKKHESFLSSLNKGRKRKKLDLIGEPMPLTTKATLLALIGIFS